MKNTFNNVMIIIIGLVSTLFSFLFFDIYSRIFTVIIGIYLLFISISNFIYVKNGKLFKREDVKGYLVNTILYFILSIILIIPFKEGLIHQISSICVGIYLILYVVINLLRSNNKLHQLNHDIFKLLFGLIIVSLCIYSISKYLSICIFILGIIYGIISIIYDNKKKENVVNENN